jgi:hypothetical protein
MNYRVHRYKEAFITLAFLKVLLLILLRNLLLSYHELITLQTSSKSLIKHPYHSSHAYK